MRDLADIPFFILLAHDDADCVPESAHVDEAKVESEESRTRDQEGHDQREFDAAHRDRKKDDFGKSLSNGTKGLINRLVDTQSVLLTGWGMHGTLAADSPGTITF